MMQGERVDFSGTYFSAREGRLHFPPVQEPYPPLYFGGASPVGRDVAAEQCDVYLTWGEPPAQVAESIADVKRRAAARGRVMRFGIRLHFIVRETDDKAWAAANELIAKIPDDMIAAAQAKFKGRRFRRSTPDAGASWRRPRQARNQSQFVGRHRPRPLGIGNRSGRIAANRRGPSQGVSKPGHRHRHRLRLPAS